MKSLLTFFFFIPFISLSANSGEIVAKNSLTPSPQDSTTISMKGDKYGVIDSTGTQVVPFDYIELYRVMGVFDGVYEWEAGFIGRKKKGWVFHDHKGEIKKEGLQFDEWIGHCGYTFPLVLLGNTVLFFDTDTQTLTGIQAYNDRIRGLDYTNETMVPYIALLKSEKTQLFGAVNEYGALMIPFECEELYAVNKAFYSAGYMKRKDKQWTYLDQFFHSKDPAPTFDDWIGNSKYEHSYVMKDGKVRIYDLETFEIADLQSDIAHYSTINASETKHRELIVIQQEKTGNFGAIDLEGNIKMEFVYREIFESQGKEETPYLGIHANRSGDFFTKDGTFILHSGEYPTLLHDDLYVRLADGPDRMAHAALAKLNMEEKKLEMITGFDFWFMNAAPRNGENPRIARASYHDNSEAYIHENGEIEPIVK